MDDAHVARVGSPHREGGLRGWLRRQRWRRRGAWLWPAFLVLTIVDGIVGHALPPQGQTQSLVAAALLGGVLSLIAVVLLSRPLGALLRRLRPDLPHVIARDYAGRGVILGVTLALTIAGLVHHPVILDQQRTMRDAIVRAQAWIGDRAPAPFRRNVRFVSVFTIEAGRLYRACVPGAGRNYCVIVDTHRPFERSVWFAGYESNAVFGAGAG